MENVVELSSTNLAKRVMVVDDDPDFANSLGDIIRAHGCDVVTVTTAQAAYHALETFLPDVVMIDVRLGKSDGTELLADFIKHPSAPTCIMMTGFASTNSAIDALKTGAYDYLTKPVSPSDLLRTLDRCFERSRLENERADALFKLESRNHDLEHVNLRLRQIVDSMGDITSSTSVTDLCHKMLEKVAGSMGVEGGSIYIREGEQLVLEHSLDPGHAPPVIPMPLSTNSVLGRVMDKGEAILVSDAASSDGLMLSGWSGYRDESLLALPLLGENNSIVGIVSLHTKQKPPFTMQDREVARILLAASSQTLRTVKAHQDLQESQSMLQLIIDSASECVKVLDLDRNLVQINPAGLAMVEADNLDQVIASGMNNIIDPEYRDAFERMTDRVYEGEAGNFVCSITGLLGTHRWMELTSVPLRNCNKGIIGALCIARDVTERREMEDELHESRSMLQLIVDAIPECVKVLDKNGNILQMNRAGLDMCEFDSFDQADGANIYPFIKPEYREALQTLNTQVLIEGISGKLEFEITGVKGTDVWLDTHVVPLRNLDHDVIGVLGVSRNITNEKHEAEQTRQHELQLMQANKMAALGTLVAGVAHEINNPNQTIQINSGLLGQAWADTMKILDQHVSTHGPFKLGGLQYSGALGAHTDLINDINIAAEQIKTVVSRLRAFSRPYDGIHENVDGAQIQINEAVEPAIALLRHAIRKGTDNFQTNLGKNLPAIQCNRQQIQQVVINLILNALEALTEKSQAITVDTRLNTAESCVELWVRDEGVGIEPDELGRLMEPFYTTKRESGGTGLGLSITHSLLKDQQASIRFESEPGKGTMVVVSLPVVLQ